MDCLSRSKEVSADLLLSYLVEGLSILKFASQFGVEVRSLGGRRVILDRYGHEEQRSG